MSGHTPGPWMVNPTGDIGWWMIGTPEKPIAQAAEDAACGLSKKEAQANARLIALSPELLAFAEFVEAGSIPSEGSNTPTAIMRWVLRIRDEAVRLVAIAKAEGR